MKRKKNMLKLLLIVLIFLFLLLGAAALLLSRYQDKVEREHRKQETIEKLESIPVVTPTPAVTITPTPLPTATPTPTPMVTVAPAFTPENYMGQWYSSDGLASVQIYELTNKYVSLYFSQANSSGTSVCEAEIHAEVAGNAAEFYFTDSQGNQAGGNLIFDPSGLYVRISTMALSGAPVYPQVNGILKRERPEVKQPDPTPTPVPAVETAGNPEEYYFPDSNTRLLTDEELSAYSSADLELAKNEIYARHGRMFVTERIAEYFNSKSWYQGTIDPQTFDAQQSSIFNETELANIQKILQWEEKKRNEGN